MKSRGTHQKPRLFSVRRKLTDSPRYYVVLVVARTMVEAVRLAAEGTLFGSTRACPTDYARLEAADVSYHEVVDPQNEAVRRDVFYVAFDVYTSTRATQVSKA